MNNKIYEILNEMLGNPELVTDEYMQSLLDEEEKTTVLNLKDEEEITLKVSDICMLVSTIVSGARMHFYNSLEPIDIDSFKASVLSLLEDSLSAIKDLEKCKL